MIGTAFLQQEHGDVEFGYDQGKIVVEFGDEGPTFEGEFPTDGIDLRFIAEPGFASEIAEWLLEKSKEIVRQTVDADRLPASKSVSWC